ncbi:CadD family cadmium resistance transporter [Metabacillus idriensis]|uniref:CadD family cadmium resistance transporter n=1 Tax=Metabacillus idriensis TaxID=324768 RepID=UPI0008AA0595|nr:CadD family cadmium resistance transporter [Metabacillus idriensis]MCM3598123.1 CadD family cadmium resistance transporter [Metabacillus idriensis]OHR63713.1 cadmium resistance protein CadD [Bacillus sp. HMSC76G11]
MDLFYTVISAIGAFIATNIDDIFVLMIFFSQVNKGFTAKHIVLGQYLGFILLVVLSLVGTFSINFIPEKWVGLLGLIPIYLGIKLFIKGEEEEDETSIIAKLQSKGGGFYFLNVAFITFANGGDNIGIYVPFFSTLNLNDLVITVITFLIMVAVWCFLGYRLASFRHVSEILEKYGRWIVPVVFIGLGLYIMAENNTFSNLWSLFG